MPVYCNCSTVLRPSLLFLWLHLSVCNPTCLSLLSSTLPVSRDHCSTGLRSTFQFPRRNENLYYLSFRVFLPLTQNLVPATRGMGDRIPFSSNGGLIPGRSLTIFSTHPLMDALVGALFLAALLRQLASSLLAEFWVY